METTPYLAAWILAVVLAIGVLSWALARHQRRVDLRREQAAQLLQALQRYSAWVCAQRLAAVFQGEGAEAAAALDQACTIRLAWFPELAGDMAQLMAVHNRIVAFLGTQQALWLRDPEHWLESEHDKRFMALWRQHRFALQALLAKLEEATSIRIHSPAPRRESTYA
ncbi:MAG: hypothetical protein K0R89_3682 [Ramlibacter sp.]|jgi:hypothetical protein|nr:hypothetical protein [Ramlibacter sp.]